MLAMIDTPDFLRSMHERSRRLAARLFERLRSQAEPLRIKVGEDLLAREMPGFAYVVEGVFKLEHAGRTVRLYTDGDLLVLDPHSGLESCKAEATHASDVLFVARPALVAALQGAPDLLHPLVELVGLESQILHVLCALYAASEHPPEVTFRRVEEGEAIVTQGQECYEIYELIQGSARVEQDGRDIGVLRAGEFIGEIGFFSDSPCAASVIASEPCFVQAIGRPQLARLVQTRPQTGIRLARGLARRVLELDGGGPQNPEPRRKDVL
jgi:CRP-like cAMP-binding protein